MNDLTRVVSLVLARDGGACASGVSSSLRQTCNHRLPKTILEPGFVRRTQADKCVRLLLGRSGACCG